MEPDVAAAEIDAGRAGQGGRQRAQGRRRGYLSGRRGPGVAGALDRESESTRARNLHLLTRSLDARKSHACEFADHTGRRSSVRTDSSRRPHANSVAGVSANRAAARIWTVLAVSNRGNFPI